MINIAFLLDKTNNWIESYVKKYISNRLNFTIEYDPSCVKNFDIVFILGYTKILDKKFLKYNKLNLIVHESNLPNGKGFSPIQWQILEGNNEIVFTLLEAHENVDSGDIFLQKKIKFSGYELFDKIRDIQGRETINLIDDFLKKYPKVKRRKQTGKETFYKRRKREDDKLDINKTIKEQFNNMRIANNELYPLWFEIDGHRYYIKIYCEKEHE